MKLTNTYGVTLTHKQKWGSYWPLMFTVVGYAALLINYPKPETWEGDLLQILVGLLALAILYGVGRLCREQEDYFRWQRARAFDKEVKKLGPGLLDSKSYNALLIKYTNIKPRNGATTK